MNTNDSPASARFAVVLRTYEWDPFIERQVGRYMEVAHGGDFYISVDDTSGKVGPIPHHRLFRSTNADLLATGLPDRAETGSLVWWNNDYPQYTFYQKHPDYDYYVFVEYDSAIRKPIADIVADIAARRIDFVAGPLPCAIKEWFWWDYTRQAYPDSEVRASINCVSVLSNRALHLLFRRRMEMGADPHVRLWPISEAFVATEIERAGYSFALLDQFGDDGAYNWFPPILEQDLGKLDGNVFLHPILDERRYIASVLNQGQTRRDYFNPGSELRQRLSRFPSEAYQSLLAPTYRRRRRIVLMEKLRRRAIRARRHTTAFLTRAAVLSKPPANVT